jgi:hypothetical protein
LSLAAVPGPIAGDRIRLLARSRADWSKRFPAMVKALEWLDVKSCLIDGELVVCDENGLTVFELLRRGHQVKPQAHLIAFAMRTCHSRIIRDESREHADPPHSLRLLRARGERPRSRAAEQRDETAPPHSMTSSARPSSMGGTSMPIALAALRLMTISNLVGCSTGSSAGLAPRAILST